MRYTPFRALMLAVLPHDKMLTRRALMIRYISVAYAAEGMLYDM